VGEPTSYVGTAFIEAKVESFKDKLNPQNWSQNASEIWQESYLIPGSVAIVSPVLIPSPLPPDRTTDPPLAPPSVGLGPGTGPSWKDQMFFEGVIFGGFRYRNILWTSYTDESGSTTTKPHIDFTYEQYECLNTKSVEVDDGGVDVDNGGSHCEDALPGQVALTFRKTVRFTQPDYAVDEVNMLAEVLVPLTLDIWLHTALF
jgi:hypothetical protein